MNATSTNHIDRMAWLTEGLDLPAPVVTNWNAGDVSCVRVGDKWLVTGGDDMDEADGEGGTIFYCAYDIDPAKPDDVDGACELIDEYYFDTWDAARDAFRAEVAATRG